MITENWKIEKIHQKYHIVKNTILLPNLHTRAPKQMIKSKKNKKNLKISVLFIFFFTKLQFLVKIINIGENE